MQGAPQGASPEELSHGVVQVAEIMGDFGSRIWMTYRKDFPAIGAHACFKIEWCVATSIAPLMRLKTARMLTKLYS